MVNVCAGKNRNLPPRSRAVTYTKRPVSGKQDRCRNCCFASSDLLPRTIYENPKSLTRRISCNHLKFVPDVSNTHGNRLSTTFSSKRYPFVICSYPNCFSHYVSQTAAQPLVYRQDGVAEPVASIVILKV